MNMRLYPVWERPIEGFEFSAASGVALARVVEAHPALAELLDFQCVDPHEIAVAVGMVYPYEEGGAEDLADIDFGPGEWYEPALGLAEVREALRAVHDDPQSIAAAIYDPGLRPADVLADLESLEQALLLAQQHETRFYFSLDA